MSHCSPEPVYYPERAMQDSSPLFITAPNGTPHQHSINYTLGVSVQSFRSHLLDPTVTCQELYVLCNGKAKAAPQESVGCNASLVKRLDAIEKAGA